jgi:hypothetical protein
LSSPRRKSPRAAKDLLEAVNDPEMDLSDQMDQMGTTDCPEGCYVEPDGWCPHGYESAGLTARLI